MNLSSAASNVRAIASGPEERLGDLSVAVRAFVLGVVIVGAVVVVVAASGMRIERPGLLVLMATLALLTSTVKLTLPLSRGVSTLSVSNALTFAAMLLLDGGSAVAIVVVSAWGQCTFRMRSRNPLHRTLFSMATLGIAAFAAARTFDVIAGVTPEAGASRSSMLAALGLLDFLRAAVPSALVYFFVNTFLIATAVGLTNHQRVHRVWLKGYLWSAPGYFVAAGVGCLALTADRWSQSWGALVAVPLYVTYRSYREFIGRIEEERAQVRQLSDVQLATIEALALAIEVKDQTSQSQIQRFQVYAEGLARSLGIDEDDVRAIKTAALLHDIGNLAIPEHILNKEGTLTDEEFRKLQIHPRVGADIVGSVPFPYPVAPLILSHHEHWDGSGYPEGLKGEDIPPGARVLTVVDFFTALLSDRPYRPAKSFGEAISLLNEAAGITLDPNFVARFVEILPELEQQVRLVHANTAVSRQVGGTAHAEGRNALDDIAGAQREVKAFFEIAQALGSTLGLDDTFRLVAEKLHELLPYSTCALFLNEGDEGRMVCRRAQGTGDVDLLRLEPLHFAELASMVSRCGSVRDGSLPLAAQLAAPLALGDRVIGALAVFHVDPGAFGPEHRRLLDLMAQQAASVVHNSLLFERAQEASLTDPLTGLSNRRALQGQVTNDLSRSDRDGTHTAFLLCDLDGLKFLNDNFGHHVGDRAIREVARVLRASLRRHDMCARYAGDEFVMVMHGCSITEALSRAKELQDAIAAVHIDVAPDQSVNLAISAGVSVFPDDGRTQEALIAVADDRMYRDKAERKRRAGRQQVTGRDAA